MMDRRQEGEQGLDFELEVMFIIFQLWDGLDDFMEFFFFLYYVNLWLVGEKEKKKSWVWLQLENYLVGKGREFFLGILFGKLVFFNFGILCYYYIV